MIKFITGPMVIISLFVAFFGTVLQVYRIKKLAGNNVESNSGQRKIKRHKSKKENFIFKIRMLKHTYIGIHKEKILLSLVFHTIIICTPFFVPAHNIMFKQFTGFSFPSIPEPLVDFLTFSVISFISVFLIRRIAVSRVRALSSFSDYIMLIIVGAPFVTGFLSCQQLVDTKLIYILHIVSGEIMLIALPFTKLVHMIFFFFGPLISIHRETFGNGARVLREDV